MNRLDKDIELAKKQLSSFLTMAGISSTPAKGFSNIFKEYGFEIPLKKDFSYSDRTNFRMKQNYDIYGKDIVYYLSNWNAKLVILLGTYSDEDFRSTSYIKLRNRYLERGKEDTFVYLYWTPNSGIAVANTVQTDSWSSYIYNTLYGYSFKPSIIFMNWNNPPI